MSKLPLANPLRTRDDVARALASLAGPLAARLSPDGARRDLGFNLGRHSDDCAGIESFARPLWGLAPWLAGGGPAEGVEGIVRAIRHGFDPAHAHYWGAPRDHDQRIAEVGAITCALLVAPRALLDPLGEETRAHVADWIARLATVQLPDNNWRFFRVFANLAAEKLGAPPAPGAIAADLDRIEQYALADGWYSDGPGGQRDHYVAFAIHFYGLLYARLEGARDPARAARLRERAVRFAGDYAQWFDAEGAALPIGRSLSYRFAHAAFWGALAYADVPALPWAELKGLWLRNLRWWWERPILDASGVLTPGYAYPNPALCEDYIGPGSAYWAFKAFLPLALAPDHPFWTAGEAPGATAPSVSVQSHPRLVVCREAGGRHVFALNAGQWATWRPRHDAARYARLCYSTRFGFSVASGATGLESGAFDSALAFSDDGAHFRTRRETVDHEFGRSHVASTWRPWPDVEVRTWLVGAPTWHLRVHRVRARRALSCIEGGFAIPCEGVDRVEIDGWAATARLARVATPSGRCDIVDLAGARDGMVVRADAGTNVMAPRTVIASLLGEVGVGETWLACAVAGTPGADPGPMPFTWKVTFGGHRIEGPNLVLDLAR